MNFEFQIDSVFDTNSNGIIDLPLNQFAKLRFDNQYIAPYTYQLQIYKDGKRMVYKKYYSRSLSPVSDVIVYRSNRFQEAPHAIIKDFYHGAQPTQPPSSENGM